VVPLNQWVEGLRQRLGDGAVPWFDPDDGGIHARILWLLEAPGPKATEFRGGSGFVSCDNNDSTAQNTWETRVEAGVARHLVVHWNVVPYYLGDGQRIKAATDDDLSATGALLSEMLALLPELRCVILGGEAAIRCWDRYAPPGHGLAAIRTKHPSPRNLNTRPQYRPLIVDAWKKALQVTGS
jgi:hypothetical protein